jgi:hypothetical protein
VRNSFRRRVYKERSFYVTGKNKMQAQNTFFAISEHYQYVIFDTGKRSGRKSAIQSTIVSAEPKARSFALSTQHSTLHLQPVSP